MESLDDATLLRRYIQDRSDDAFRALVDRYTSLVYSACRRQTGRADLAEDATQSVFITLAQRAHRLADHPTLAGWLYSCACRVSKNTIRQEVRRMNRERNAVLGSHGPDDLADSLKPFIDEALARLRRRDREIIVLRFLHGHSLSELAGILGIREDAARMRVNRATESLRRELSRAGLATRAMALAEALPKTAEKVPPSLITTLMNRLGTRGPIGSPFRVPRPKTGVSPNMSTTTLIVVGSIAALSIGGVGITKLGHRSIGPTAPVRQTDKASPVDGPKVLDSMVAELGGKWHVTATSDQPDGNRTDEHPNVTVRFDKKKSAFVIVGVKPAGAVTTWKVDRSTGGIQIMEPAAPGVQTPFFHPVSTSFEGATRTTRYEAKLFGFDCALKVVARPTQYTFALTGQTPAGDTIPRTTYVFDRR